MANVNRILDDIRKEYGNKVARAFADALRSVRKEVVLRRFIEAIDSGNIEAALRALNVDETLFAAMRQEIIAAYNASAVAVVANTRFSPPRATRAVVRWDASNPIAERYTRTVIGEHITQITRDTLDGARERIAAGYAQGQGPRQIALDVVGRVGPNGQRVGGVLGLNGPQSRAVTNMRAALERGDMSAVMRLSRRDRRFDRTLMSGRDLTPAQIDRMVTAYENRLLKLRGDTIARTETASAVERARVDGFRAGLDAQDIPPQYVTKEWLHGGGGMKPRTQHLLENFKIVEGMDTPFVMGDGTLLQYPHDPNAPAKHTINCTCTAQINIDWVRLRRDGLV